MSKFMAAIIAMAFTSSCLKILRVSRPQNLGEARTSFNIRDERIINAPSAAIHCFNDIDLDELILKHHLLAKQICGSLGIPWCKAVPSL